MFKWVNGSVYTLILTLYQNNITLNSSATSYFHEVRWAMIGLDKENYQLGIKPVTKREVDLHLIPLEQLHKVSIGKGYARISNKLIIEEIAGMINKPIDGLKVNAIYDQSENMLIADLHDLIVEQEVKK